MPILSHLKSAFARIHLVDKCLIVFMVLLLAQSTYNLFSAHSPAAATNSIDVIIRTSIASIFGYFLSGNFIRNSAAHRKPPDTHRSAEDNLENRTVFSADDTSAHETISSGHAFSEPAPSTADIAEKLQIWVAFGLGLFCLIALIILNNLISPRADVVIQPTFTATVTQFRDIVSGCVGFLIGTPTTKLK